MKPVDNPFRKIALVVPSIRKESFERFCDEWREHGLFDSADLILMEDNPEPTFEIPGLWNHAMGGQCYHLSWRDIDKNKWSWIIPRRSDTVRSFGYWFAWNQGYQFLCTLDDDCYPSQGYEKLVKGHLQMLTSRTRWFNTLNCVTPRGIPYKNLGERQVMMNHGLWTGVLDYDAPHQLVEPKAEVYTHDNRIVPHGSYFPFCGMNWMCSREMIPLTYHLLMGKMFPIGPVSVGARESQMRQLQFDRFGDIWCGIFMKKICDHLGWQVSSGTPYIHHDRASNPFTNLRKEANGIEVNEWLWQKVDSIVIPNAMNTATKCYSWIADEVQNFGGEHAEYWKTLAAAMQIWADLFVE